MQSAQAKQDRLKRRAIDVVLADQPALLATVNDELASGQENIEQLATQIADLSAAFKRLEEAATETNRVTEHIELIRKAWAQDNRTDVRSLLRSLIRQVDVRADRLGVRINALPGMRVYELDQSLGPAGIEPATK